VTQGCKSLDTIDLIFIIALHYAFTNEVMQMLSCGDVDVFGVMK
jgi:hypothetical protein